MCMCHDKIHIKGFLIPHEKVLQNIWVDESKLTMSLFFNILAEKKKKDGSLDESESSDKGEKGKCLKKI